MVKDRVTDVQLRAKLENQLKAVSDYLKHGYVTHLEFDDYEVHNKRMVVVGNEYGNCPRSFIQDGVQVLMHAYKV